MSFRHSKICKTDWNTVLSIHYYAVEVFLYEIALCDTIEDERYGTYSLARLGMLYACLNSVRLLFDQVHAISSSEWYDTPYTTWALVSHALVVLSRLSLCKADGWDTESNCSIVDFSTLIDALAHKFEVEQNVLQLAPPPQIFLMVSSRLQLIKAAHETKYAAQMSVANQIPRPSGADPTPTTLDDELFMPLSYPFFDFLDESFWSQP